jgi:hypothetical protein
MFCHILAAADAAARCLLKAKGFGGGLDLDVHCVGDSPCSPPATSVSVYAESTLLEPHPCLN